MFTAINHQRRNGTIFHPLQFIKPLHDSNCCMVLRPVWLFVWWRGLISCMKKSFILYNDSLSIFKELTNEQAGILIKAIIDYNNDIEPELDFGLKMAFLPFKNQFVRDSEKWENVRNKRVEAGIKGGKQKVANASKSKHKVANVAVNVNDSVSVNVSDSVNDTVNNKTRLQLHIEKSYLKVAKMKKQLTIEESNRITSEFENKVIDEVLQAMENKADLLKKYDSVNLTLRNWIKNRKENQKPQDNKTTGSFFDIHEKIIQGKHE